MPGTTTPTGRRTDEYAREARAAADRLNAALTAAALPFQLAAFRVVDERGYPTFSVEMTAKQAGMLADVLAFAEADHPVDAPPVTGPCETQDTAAAALIAGDVVLGPGGWVIVEHIETLIGKVPTGPSCVRIHAEGHRMFDRDCDQPVTVQPDADTASSASRQHFIDTGRYLRRATDEPTDADILREIGMDEAADDLEREVGPNF